MSYGKIDMTGMTAEQQKTTRKEAVAKGKTDGRMTVCMKQRHDNSDKLTLYLYDRPREFKGRRKREDGTELRNPYKARTHTKEYIMKGGPRKARSDAGRVRGAHVMTRDKRERTLDTIMAMVEQGMSKEDIVKAMG